jgi:hypothetical protein
VRRSLAALAIALTVVVALAGCGDSGKSGAPGTPKNTAGMDPTKNAATATQFFEAVASNDPAKVEAAYELAAPNSPALGYLKLLHDGLEQSGAASTVTVKNGRYQLCLADAPKTCHTFSAVVLSDGKVNDFTVDGKKIRLR